MGVVMEEIDRYSLAAGGLDALADMLRGQVCNALGAIAQPAPLESAPEIAPLRPRQQAHPAVASD
jgi:hypothetical protein